MEDHLVEHGLAGILHSQGYHGQTIPNQNHIHPCSIGDVAAGEVVGREHCNWFLGAMHGAQGVEGHLLAWVRRRWAHG